MQNETTDKNAESSGKKSWLRLVPIPFTVFLTAMFYLQGKAYHAGYLVYFHLDNTQMSISTSDAMWLAYRAWGNGAAHILLTSGDWFLDMLMSILLPATIGCVVLILLLVIEKLRRKAAKPRVSATAIPFKDLSLRRQIAYIAAGLAGYVLAIPGSILVIALLVACSLIVLVEPFGVIGKRDAQDYCQEVPLAALPTIPHLPGFDPNQGSSINSGATPTPAPSCRRAQRPPCPNRPLPEQSARRCRNACPASRIPRIPPCARRSPRLRTTSRKTEASSPRRPDRAAMHAVRFLAAIALSASHLSGDAGILRELTRKVEPRHGPERKQERPDPVS